MLRQREPDERDINLFGTKFKREFDRYGGVQYLLDKGKIIPFYRIIQMLKGRRVCIVGPAEYVVYETDDTHGSLIDSYDIVIKINRMIRFEKSERDIDGFFGKRLDILFTTIVNSDESEKFANIYKNIKKRTIIVIRAFRWDNTIYHEFLTNGNIILSFYGPGRIDPIKSILGGTLPTTGFIALYESIMNARETYITGLTFGHPDGVYDDYVEEYLPAGTKVPRLRDVYGHNTVMEKEHILRMRNRHNIKVDPYLQRIFSK